MRPPGVEKKQIDPVKNPNENFTIETTPPCGNPGANTASIYMFIQQINQRRLLRNTQTGRKGR